MIRICPECGAEHDSKKRCRRCPPCAYRHALELEAIREARQMPEGLDNQNIRHLKLLAATGQSYASA